MMKNPEKSTLTSCINCYPPPQNLNSSPLESYGWPQRERIGWPDRLLSTHFSGAFAVKLQGCTWSATTSIFWVLIPHGLMGVAMVRDVPQGVAYSSPFGKTHPNTIDGSNNLICPYHLLNFATKTYLSTILLWSSLAILFLQYNMNDINILLCSSHVFCVIASLWGQETSKTSHTSQVREMMQRRQEDAGRLGCIHPLLRCRWKEYRYLNFDMDRSKVHAHCNIS